jgi:hypothetical protein
MACVAEKRVIYSADLPLAQARKIEEAFVWQCQRAGVLPPAHALVADAGQLATFLDMEGRERRPHEGLH